MYRTIDWRPETQREHAFRLRRSLALRQQIELELTGLHIAGVVLQALITKTRQRSS